MEASAGRAETLQKFPTHLTPPYPTTYTLELTASCNHQCIGCGNVFSRQRQQMPATFWEKVLHRIKDSVKRLRITGGECTLHPDFKEILQAVDQLSIPFVVFTNGNWVDPQRIIQCFTSCEHLEGLLVSLHGHDRASHERFVQCDTFDVVIRNIRQAVETGIYVETNTILLKSNIAFIKAIVAQNIALGVKSVAFSRYYGRALPSLELSPDELYSALVQIENLRKKEPRVVFNNCVPFCFTSDLDLPTKGCTSGFSHCTIDPWGDARPCTHSPLILGNVLEHDIKDIWNGEPINRWRNLVPEDCIKCAAFDLCRGGCRATAYHRQLSRDPLVRSPIKVLPTVSTRLSLFRHTCPIPNYTLQEDKSGIRLINNNHRVSISKKALPILQMIDGQTSLVEIQTQFGNVAIDFVGTLMLKGLVK